MRWPLVLARRSSSRRSRFATDSSRKSWVVIARLNPTARLFKTCLRARTASFTAPDRSRPRAWWFGSHVDSHLYPFGRPRAPRAPMVACVALCILDCTGFAHGSLAIDFKPAGGGRYAGNRASTGIGRALQRPGNPSLSGVILTQNRFHTAFIAAPRAYPR